MKTAIVQNAQTRRDVPQVLGLCPALFRLKVQDVERQHEDPDWLETRYGIQIYKRLIIEGAVGSGTPSTTRTYRQFLHELTGSVAQAMATRRHRPAGEAASEEDFTSYSIFQPFANVHKPIYSKRDGFVEPWTPEGHDACVDAAKKARSERLELRRRSMDEKLVLAKLRGFSARRPQLTAIGSESWPGEKASGSFTRTRPR